MGCSPSQELALHGQTTKVSQTHRELVRAGVSPLSSCLGLLTSDPNQPHPVSRYHQEAETIHLTEDEVREQYLVAFEGWGKMVNLSFVPNHKRVFQESFHRCICGNNGSEFDSGGPCEFVCFSRQKFLFLLTDFLDPKVLEDSGWGHDRTRNEDFQGDLQQRPRSQTAFSLQRREFGRPAQRHEVQRSCFQVRSSESMMTCLTYFD